MDLRDEPRIAEDVKEKETCSISLASRGLPRSVDDSDQPIQIFICYHRVEIVRGSNESGLPKTKTILGWAMRTKLRKERSKFGRVFVWNFC